jgi:hypothetical protein
MANCAVDINHATTLTTGEVMVVIAHAVLI